MILLLLFLFGAVHGGTIPQAHQFEIGQQSTRNRREAMEYRWEDILITVRNDQNWLIQNMLIQCVRSDDVYVTPSNCGGVSRVVQNATVIWKSSEMVNWETAIERCELKGGRLFDGIKLSEEEGKAMCEGNSEDYRFWSSWWSPADSGVWRDHLTSVDISDDYIDWSPDMPQETETKDKVAVYACNEKKWTDVDMTTSSPYVCILED